MNRTIILGVTGSIATYKAADLIRLFVKNGDKVHVIMTPAACKFIKPLTFQTLSQNPVLINPFAPVLDWKPEHISLAEAADLVVIAPATANSIAKMRIGLADNLLMATVLATKAPILIAPAMNTGMWEAAATQQNIKVLKTRGVRVVAPQDGDLACGAVGKGRMADPKDIFRAAQ